MLSKLITPVVVAASVMAAPRALLPRADTSLANWASNNYESYWTFKNRYNSLNCASQTGTSFFDECCNPLGANDSLASRPAHCTPATLTCGSVVTTQNSVTTPPVNESNESTESTPEESYNDYDYEDDYDESTLPWCEPGQDEYGNYSTESIDSTDVPDYVPPETTPDYTPPPVGNNNNNNGGGGGGGEVMSGGYATFFYQHGNAGACGDRRADSDLLVALHYERYGDLGQRSANCGRWVHITNLNNGRSVDAVVADACPTCVNNNSLDLSEGAFVAIASTDDGMVPITWSYI